MRNEQTDLALLYDIYVAAKDIVGFVEGITINIFAKNKMARAAVERKLEVIGEAVKRLTDAFKSAHPDIPWSRIIAQRNIIAHEYDRVQIEKLWIVATESIPQLLVQVEPLIPPEYRQPDGEAMPPDSRSSDNTINR
jgi:uncharacterized protein with HEPN domain